MKAILKVTDEELSALEDVLSYYVMAAEPNGTYGGPADSATEEEAESFAFATALFDRVSALRARRERIFNARVHV